MSGLTRPMARELRMAALSALRQARARGEPCSLVGSRAHFGDTSAGAAILLNPRLFFWDPEMDRRRMLRRTISGFTHSTAWGRFEEEEHLPPKDNSRIRCIRIANGGHALRPLWAQKVVHELIDRDLDGVLREGSPGFEVDPEQFLVNGARSIPTRSTAI